MRFILVYYKKSKYIGFTRKYIKELYDIWDLNQMLKDKDIIKYSVYELRGEKNGR